MIDDATRYIYGSATKDSVCVQATPVTAPRTSPLTEEEAHQRWHEARGWKPPTEGLTWCGVDCRAAVDVALRVDSEARAAALRDVKREADQLFAAHNAVRADLDEAVRLLREMRGEHHVYRPDCEWPPESGARCASCRIVEPTPSTPTSTEET